MKVPLSWLKDYVDFEGTVEELCDKLTFSGIEVEGVETVGGAPPHVVAAEVLEVAPHPNSDHLHLCRVDYGAAEQPVIVCGAPNVTTGGKYPFAPLGTTLPGGFTIEKRAIRGIESCGMLCAADELGLSTDHTGLLPLAPNVQPGTPLSKIYGPPETVFHVEITPNRPDELSMIGIAREVAALLQAPLKIPTPEIRETTRPIHTIARLEVQDPADCPRYIARVLENVRVAPSPPWMQRRLEAAGIRAINNIVDITNYVMLECGQPLHAFDYALLEEGRILVRHPKPAETITTLDGVKRTLDPHMLAICDASKPMAIAGVMGGEHSGISPHTSTVLLESATFRPAAIRATAKQLGLISESAFRYARGVCADLADYASRRAAQLICQLAGASLRRGALDLWPNPKKPWNVTCRRPQLESLLGITTTTEEMQRIFTALGLHTLSRDKTTLTLRIPTFREDLTREADLIEEFIRIYGLKNLPAPPPVAVLVPNVNDQPFQAKQNLRTILAGLGLQEAMNYSFLADPLLDRFDPAAAPSRVRLNNPLTTDHTTLRPSLLPQLVANIGANVSRQVEEVALFEIGRTFQLDAHANPTEEDRLAIALFGPVGRTGLDKFHPVSNNDMLLWTKGLWEQLAAALSLRGVMTRPANRPFATPNAGLSLLVEGKPIGWLGLLLPAIAREWRIPSPIGLLETSLSPLLRIPTAHRKLAPPPPFPAIRRDVALIVADTVQHEQILKIARHAAPRDLEKIELFDIYQGKTPGPGKKSMAYAFTYRSPTTTLTDQTANTYQQKINDALKSRLPAEIREN